MPTARKPRFLLTPPTRPSIFVVFPRPSSTRKIFEEQPPLPVLPETRLRLDLLLAQPSLDLRAILDVIMTDIGACLQVWRCANDVGGSGPRHATRIEDCLIHLGGRGLRRAFGSMFPAKSDTCYAATREFWLRARRGAELAQTIAEHVPSLLPSDARLAALVHEMGRIPALLGWRSGLIDWSNPIAVAHSMAREWRLPAYVEPTLLLSPGSLQSGATLRRVVAVAWQMCNADGAQTSSAE